MSVFYFLCSVSQSDTNGLDCWDYFMFLKLIEIFSFFSTILSNELLAEEQVPFLTVLLSAHRRSAELTEAM